ncbi:nitrous oxide reductase family maturation protein NosD [Flexithrix dorotheae]|uniref:nitrous oxide reductase family maturation protein NosD n=1 Tax=Flexithrix dorotheae TaxID=70993 RepID=UPI00037B9978|nr:nitrous oxide reductase family maturation protein NosD [Flexithrix dorotheae]
MHRLNKIKVLIIIWGMLISGSAFSQDIIVVCPDCKVSSIKQAIEKAKSGDEIVVKNGVYKETGIRIEKKLSIYGENFPEIDGQNLNQEIISVAHDSVTISGFVVKNVGVSYIDDLAAIKVYEHKGCVIENNKIQNAFFGIYLNHSNNCVIRNNEVIGEAVAEMSSGNAIHLWYARDILIEGNLAKNHRDGIYLEFVENSKVSDNVSEGNLRYGLHFMFSNHNTYSGNTFQNNGAGVAVMFSRFITMTKNKFYKNWGTSSYGLLLKEIFDGEITNNYFEENTVGIYAEGSNRMKIENNDFKSNGWAMKILGSCMDNTFTGNNFFFNTFDITTNARTFESNKISRNYWSEYTGYDLDKDGIGDQPYRPVKVFSFVITRVPASIILLRSLFIDMLNFAEKVMPVMTPSTLMDEQPLMKPADRSAF